jgi:hypothetical protein
MVELVRGYEPTTGTMGLGSGELPGRNTSFEKFVDFLNMSATLLIKD